MLKQRHRLLDYRRVQVVEHGGTSPATDTAPWRALASRSNIRVRKVLALAECRERGHGTALPGRSGYGPTE